MERATDCEQMILERYLYLVLYVLYYDIIYIPLITIRNTDFF